MSDQHNAPRAADARAITRTNMYMAAVLRWNESSSTAKIRNMSPWGALVESASCPLPGSAVCLIRGSLNADGKIAWVAEGRCGIRFDAPHLVNEWMSAPVNQEQNRIDRSIDLLRAGAVPIAAGRQSSREQTAKRNSTEKAGVELAALAYALENLASQLGDDPYVVQKFWRELQSFDQIAQGLDIAAAFLIDGCRNESEFAPRLRHLRATRAESADQVSEKIADL